MTTARTVRTIELTTPWGGHEAGQKLHVLGPGEPIKGACVDAQRSAQLLEDGIAVDPAAERAAAAAADKAAPKTTTRKKKPRKRKG